MAIQIQLRRDFLANWASENPILADGEFGYEKDTSKFKIGDGVTDWNSLPYLTSATSATVLAHLANTYIHVTLEEKSYWNSAYNLRHNHLNKTLLDTYTQTEANLADAVSKKHTQNSDTILAESTIDEVSANEIRTHIDDTDIHFEKSDIEFTDLGDTPSAYTGEGGKGVRVKVTVDGLEFYTIVDTDEKVKYDAGDPTAGYVADKVIAGDGIDVAEGIGADENKLVITNTDKGSDVVVPVNADFTLAGLGEKSYSSLTDIPASFNPTSHGNGSHSTDLVGEPGVIDAKDEKTTPVDADVMILEDSEDLALGLKKPKKITLANIKATIKLYTDTLYETVGALAGHLLAYNHGDIAHTNRADLDNVSGTNTGDQSSSDFNHDALTNTHNLTTDIDHNSITNTHNLTTDIDHDSITNTHNLTTDIDHDSITNTHNLSTDIDHNGLTNTHGAPLILDQSSPQEITGGIPILEATRVIDDNNQLVDKQYVDQAVTSLGARFYMTNVDSGIQEPIEAVDYKLTALEPVSVFDNSYASLANDDFVAGFISPLGFEFSKMIAGNYAWNIIMEKTAGTKSLRVYWKLYKYEIATGTETLLGTSIQSNLITSKLRDRLFMILDDDVTIGAGYRIIGKIYAVVGTSGSAPTLKIYGGGTDDSHWAVPINTEILNDVYKLRPNQTSITSSATPTPTGNYQENELYITALAEASELQAPSGTPVNGNRILARIDAAAEQNLTYNAIYSGNMPDVVEAGITLYMEFIYSSTSSKWEYIESGGGGHGIYSQEEVTPVEQRKLLRFKGFLQATDNAGTEETEVEIDDALTSTFEGVVEVNVRVELDDSLGRNLVDDTWTSNFFDRDGEESQKGTYGDWEYVCIDVDTWVRYPLNKDIKDLFHSDVDVIASLEDEDNWTTDNEYDPADLPTNLGDACCHVNKNADVSTLYMIINAGSGDVARIRTYPSHVNRLAEEDIAEHGILALTDLHGVAHSGIPAGYIIDSIIIKETSDNSAGDISIGTTAGGTDVVNALSVGALAEVLATLGTTFFSTATAQNLYISSTIGAVTEFSVNAGGTGYSVDDILTITGGNSDFTIKVLTIGGSGEVLTAEITTAGTGYSIGDANAVTGGTGNDDCTIDIDNLGLADALITLKINIKKVW